MTTIHRKLNRDLLDKWLARHGPDGVSELAVRSKVSASTIHKVRAKGTLPKPCTIEKLCKPLRCKPDDLFPPVSAGTGEAS